jgi:hypothetical protein
VHIPVKTTADYDTNLPLETIQKQPLAMSKFLFSGRRQSTHKSHSNQISKWQHAYGKRTIDLSEPTDTSGQLQSVINFTKSIETDTIVY